MKPATRTSITPIPKPLWLSILMLGLTAHAAFADLGSGLVGYYPFNGNSNDESGQGNHGTVVSGSFVNDRFGVPGSALKLTGSANMFTQALSSNFDYTNSLTISVWVNFKTLSSASYPCVAGIFNQCGSWEASIVLDWKDQQKIKASEGVSCYELAPILLPQTPEANRWYHLVLTHDQGDLAFYVDGSLVGTANYIPNVSYSSGPHFLRLGNPASWGFLDGLVDDVRIYNRALSSQEVAMLAQSPAVPLPPQIVCLAFGQDAPFRLRGAFNFYFEAAGTTNAATLTPQYKTEIMAAVRQMFSASGITNIIITDVPTTGATTVYFSDENLNISGKALGGIDRFNERAEDKVIVYTFGDAIYDAETVAHEVGHSLGLLHVNPGTRTTSEGLIKEVMYAPEVSGALPRFINAVSDHDSLNVADTLYTHNPLFHLKRYLDGYTSHQLETQGILPGTWDVPFTDLIAMRLDFGDTQRTLYNVVLLRSSDGTTSVSPIAQFASITLAELEQKRFHLVPGTCLSLVGSSTPEGESDLVLSTGDPHIEESRFVPADSDTIAVTLQQLNDTAFDVIATATTTGELVPRLPTVTNFVRLSTPGQFSMTFAGDIGASFIIETSPDLHSWSDCESVRAEAAATTVLLTSPTSDPKRFWRIKRGQP